jgi:hypothetical protein
MSTLNKSKPVDILLSPALLHSLVKVQVFYLEEKRRQSCSHGALSTISESHPILSPLCLRFRPRRLVATSSWRRWRRWKNWCGKYNRESRSLPALDLAPTLLNENANLSCATRRSSTRATPPCLNRSQKSTSAKMKIMSPA